MEKHASTACSVGSGVCRAMKPTEYSEEIKTRMRTKYKGDAVCVSISVRDREKPDSKPFEMPLLLYAHKQRDVPFCDATRTLGAYRLVVRRTAKRRDLPEGTSSPYTAMCESRTSAQSDTLDKILNLGAIKKQKSFTPQVADIKHNDALLSASRLEDLISTGVIRRVGLKVQKRERRRIEHNDVSSICKRCSFYLAHVRGPIEDAGSAQTAGCYYLYDKRTCPHTRAAPSGADATKLNGTSTMSMNALGKYVVATGPSSGVDLARWIYAKFHGTVYTDDGRCVSEPDGREAAEAGRDAKREAEVMRGTTVVRLAGREVPRHVPLSSLQLRVAE